MQSTKKVQMFYYNELTPSYNQTGQDRITINFLIYNVKLSGKFIHKQLCLSHFIIFISCMYNICYYWYIIDLVQILQNKNRRIY